MKKEQKPDNLYLNIKPSNPVDWCFDKKNLLVLVDDNFKGIVGENVTQEQVGEIAKLLTEPAKEPIADCDNCKHRCTKSNIDYCQMYEPKPTFKVGDWVKHDVDSYLQVIEPSDKDKTWCRTLSGIMVYPYTSLLTKVSPSEVVIHIGCLSGTVAERFPGCYWAFKLIHSDDMESSISLHALDTRTRELVESLLKAQEEK